jgi:hypothetical protein
MTKSADYGQFHEDAYIIPCSTSYRYVKPKIGYNIYQYSIYGMRLDHSREYVRKNINNLTILDRALLSKPWQCKCEIEDSEQAVAVVSGTQPILINGQKVEGSIELLRQLLGIQ